jgi:hypothetical protein
MNNSATSFKANKAIRLARKHIGGAMESSARLCLADAINLFDSGDVDFAHHRALKSLAYSVGILSPVYKECK